MSYSCFGNYATPDLTGYLGARQRGGRYLQFQRTSPCDSSYALGAKNQAIYEGLGFGALDRYNQQVQQYQQQMLGAVYPGGNAYGAGGYGGFGGFHQGYNQGIGGYGVPHVHGYGGHAHAHPHGHGFGYYG